MLYYVDYIPSIFLTLTDFPDIYYDESYNDQFIIGGWVSGINTILGWVQCFAGIGMSYTDSHNIVDGKEVLQFSFMIDFLYDICIHNGRPFRAHELGHQVCIHQDLMLYHRRWTRIHPQALRFYYRYLNGVYFYWVMPDGSVEVENEMTHYVPFTLNDVFGLLQPAGEPISLEG
jgi:hypothetical protein